ncbi:MULTISPECIES: DUF2145 domain-containing protein [Oxalobacteraceae]|uniref:DUF2145 domain-containing protein n=1 Tax=Herminiimonas sp. Marseille-P9896 TaxID=2742211 RepID=UPI00158D9E84|nr:MULTISPECIES: DUF2145 domain-containing protein [Oxalobacteraceae]
MSALIVTSTVTSAAYAASGSSAASNFCDRAHQLTAAQQDRILRFAGVVREELAAVNSDTVLISRSGLDLSRFQIRYSHAAIAWRDEDKVWTARQLYYACEEERPRIFDQGMAGFAMGIDNPSLGYISIVKLPEQAAQSLRQAALDKPRALRLLAATYSANAYVYALNYQNCNQWVMETMAAGWGDLPDGEDLRARAQLWLQQAHYAPEPTAVNSHWLMFASSFVPLLHLDDHPAEDRYALKLKISLPATVETFVHQQYPDSERVEICHDGKQVVVHRGWTPIADGCVPAAGDRVVPLDS